MKLLLSALFASLILLSTVGAQGKFQEMDKDSLLTTLKNETIDTNRVKIYLVLHNKFRLSEFLKARSYADSAYLLAKDIKWQKGIAKSSLELGTSFSLTGEADKAIEFLNESLKASESLGDTRTEANAYMTLGNIEYDKGNYAEALPNYYKCFDKFKETDYYPGMSAALIWVGIIYQYGQQDYEKAIETYKDADKYAIIGSSDLNRSYIVSNLADIYHEIKEYDSAIAYSEKSIEIKTKFKDTRGLSNTFNNLANVYYDIENFDKALEYYDKSFELRKSISDSTGIATSFVNLGKVEIARNNYQKSIDYSNQGLAIASRIDHKEAIREAYEFLSLAYEKRGDYRASLAAYKEYKTISDTLFNTESEKILAELNTKYDTEKKENKIAMQASEIARQESANQRNVALIIALVVASISLVVVIILIRSRSRKKEQLLIQENELKVRDAQMSAAINSQEKERSRFAKDLHDGFGQMISVLNLNLKSLNDDKEKSHEVFENSSKVLEEMYTELKSICFNLMPQTLIQHGIGPAITEFANRINASRRIHVAIDLFGLDERLPELVEISLYRITQEWVNNILKYSDATTITVQITKEAAELTLLIEDNGMGFDKNLLINGKGNGWSNINSRVNLVKGEINLDTVPQRKGNTLIAELTLEKQSLENLHTAGI